MNVHEARKGRTLLRQQLLEQPQKGLPALLRPVQRLQRQGALVHALLLLHLGLYLHTHPPMYTYIHI